jgi:hypothetical protein
MCLFAGKTQIGGLLVDPVPCHDLVRTEGGVTTAYTRAEALERLRNNHYHLWCVLKEVEADPSLPDKWREVPGGSQGWRKLVSHEQALRVLQVSMSD